MIRACESRASSLGARARRRRSGSSRRKVQEAAGVGERSVATHSETGGGVRERRPRAVRLPVLPTAAWGEHTDPGFPHLRRARGQAAQPESAGNDPRLPGAAGLEPGFRSDRRRAGPGGIWNIPALVPLSRQCFQAASFRNVSGTDLPGGAVSVRSWTNSPAAFSLQRHGCVRPARRGC